jgi:RNA polymerase sigma-70 factor (ECF subfamily)
MTAVRKYRALTDNQLVQEIQAGRTDLFAELVERNQSRVYAVAYSILGDRQAARDIAQETFVVAYRRLETFRGESQLWSWLYTVTRRLALHELRRVYRRPDLTLDEPIGHDEGGTTRLEMVESDLEGAQERVERDDVSRRVREALRALGDKHREILVLRHFEDLSYKEIAERLGIPEGTVMSRLWHARRKVVTALGEDVDWLRQVC